MILGFAGAGNIAAAMARGWAGEDEPAQMLFCDSGSGRATRLAAETGGEAVDSLTEVALRSDAVVLAVKPASLERVAEQLAHESKAVLSVLGATPLARLREVFGATPVVRIMPTIATEIGQGVICHAPIDPELDGRAGAELIDLVSELGHLVEVADDDMDLATALMACPPAYLAMIVQTLAEAGRDEGLEPELSYELVVESFAGTLEVLRRYDPISVRAAVASPGGSTEAGLGALADAGTADAFRAAVVASLKRMRG